MLTLTPTRGSCLDRVLARGARFPAGRAVTLTAVQTGPGSGRSPAYRVIARPTAAADGAFAVEFALPPVAPHGCGQCGAGGCGADPTGEEYTITAIVDRAPGDPRVAVARAAFTATSPALPPAAVPRAGDGGARGQAAPPWRVTFGLLALAGGAGVVRRRGARGRRHVRNRAARAR